MTDRLRIDITGSQGSGKSAVAALLRGVFDPNESWGGIALRTEKFLDTHERPVVYDDGVPPDYHVNRDIKPLHFLRDFVDAFESGAQGCMMDHEDSQHLALGIKQALSALDATHRALFLMKNGREPTAEEMAR